jgi:ABC-type polysaccharide/polyol phosphate transport system ATPase subunit
MTSSTGSEPAIALDAVGVRYWMPSYRGASLKEYVIERVSGRGGGGRRFAALRGVDLRVEPGEAFGVIGANGAGKSTLLRVAAGILRPTEGRVRIRGRVAPVLDLSPGFHAELSGRENVFLNGAMLGYRRAELVERAEEIAAFADIGEFLSAPLRTYSAGMAVRLAFAICRRPDVLVVDEVLAVGDAAFRGKCDRRLREFRDSGTTLLLVSHALAEVARSCDRALWLDHGEVRAIAPRSSGCIRRRPRRRGRSLRG